MTTILALETATDGCSVALLHGSRIAQRQQVAPRQHTTLVFEMMDAVLDELALSRSAVELVAFGHGPGTFTGVRVATSVAQGVSLALNCPVLGISSLAALARGAAQRGHEGRVAVLLDARRGETYYASFVARDGEIERLLDDQLIAPTELLLAPGDDWLGVGNGWLEYREQLPSAYRALVPSEPGWPQAADTACLARDALSSSVGLRAENAQPMYLRGAVD